MNTKQNNPYSSLPLRKKPLKRSTKPLKRSALKPTGRTKTKLPQPTPTELESMAANGYLVKNPHPKLKATTARTASTLRARASTSSNAGSTKARKPIAKRSKSPRAKAKKDAWDAFSVYIRTRDCIATTGTPDEGICVTCEKRYPFSKLQAGHFIDGRTNAVLFMEQGVHIQCGGCNVMKHGNKVSYWLYMEKRYGRAMIDKLIADSKKSVVYKEYNFIELAEFYKEKTNALLQER